MKKKLLLVGAIIAVVLIGVIVFFATKKEPGTITLSVTTKDGFNSAEFEDESIVDVKKGGVAKNTTMVDKKTGKSTAVSTYEVRYDFTAKKKGSTKLTVKYDDYKTDEEVEKVYEIIVDDDLKITINDL